MLMTIRLPKVPAVALLAEGVDRNYFDQTWTRAMPMSPSSRRAWIEIKYGLSPLFFLRSPSSRRAWIEITSAPKKPTA